MFLRWISLSFAIIKCYKKKLFLVVLFEKWTSWASLFGSGLSFTFHWRAQSLMFLRSLFNLSRETYLSWRKENKDVSSAKILHLELRLSLKSFIYTVKTKEGQELNLVKTKFYHFPRRTLTMKNYSLLVLLKIILEEV